MCDENKKLLKSAELMIEYEGQCGFIDEINCDNGTCFNGSEIGCCGSVTRVNISSMTFYQTNVVRAKEYIKTHGGEIED